ncbi:MAG: dihydrodipicolinate synthase family protein [Christensenella sp.]|nr:dihydrodipicolinate synthase family protein [Christensenella sp.]
MSNLFQGTITELMTPYHTDYTIDYDGLGQEIDFQVKSGVNGIFVNGIASECPFMSLEYHKEMLRFAVRKTNGRLPVMANIFVNGTSTALELAKSYEENGADAICITQPCIYPFTENSLYQHYTAIIRATGLPVYVYNAPQTSNTMSPGLVARLMNENENVKGYKESTQDLIHVQTIMRNVERDLDFLSGSDGTILPIMQVGGRGIISLISVVFPQPIIDLCDAAFANDKEKAIECQHKVLAIREILKSAPFLAGYKYAADLVGEYPGGKVLAPLEDATDKQRAHIKEELEKLGLI